MRHKAENKNKKFLENLIDDENKENPENEEDDKDNIL